MIDVEVTLVFYAACFFTALYLWRRTVGLGVIAMVSWWTTGFLWLFLAHEAPSYQGYAVALLFHGIGFVTLIDVIMDLLQSIKLKRYGESDLD